MGFLILTDRTSLVYSKKPAARLASVIAKLKPGLNVQFICHEELFMRNYHFSRYKLLDR